MKFGVNALGMGLLGGAAGFAGGFEKYLEQQRVLDNRLQAYKYHYDRMADVQQQRQTFNQQMAIRKLQAMQRNGLHFDTGPNGEIMRHETQTIYGPDGTPETKIGPGIPLSKFSQDSSKSPPHLQKYQQDGMNVTVFPDGSKVTSPIPALNKGAPGKDATPNVQVGSVSSVMNHFLHDDEPTRNRTLRSFGIDPSVITDPQQQYNALEKAVEGKQRERGDRFSTSGGAVNQSDIDAASHDPNSLDGLVQGKDGLYTPQGADGSGGQKVFFNPKMPGVPFIQAHDKDGNPIPGGYKMYRPQTEAATPDQSSTADTSGYAPGVLNSVNNDEQVNNQIAGIGGEDNDPYENPYYNEEDEQT